MATAAQPCLAATFLHAECSARMPWTAETDLDEGRLSALEGGSPMGGTGLLQGRSVAPDNGGDDLLVEVHGGAPVLWRAVSARDVRVRERPDPLHLPGDQVLSRKIPQNPMELVVQLDDLEPVRRVHQGGHLRVEGSEVVESLVVRPDERAQQLV